MVFMSLREGVRRRWRKRSAPAFGAAFLLLPLGCSDVSGLLLGELPEGDGEESEPSSSGGSSIDDSPPAPPGGAGGALGEQDEPPAEPTQDWALACSPVVTFENRDPGLSGQVSASAVGEPTAFIHAAAQRICPRLYSSSEAVLSVPSVQLILEDFEGVGTIGGETLRLSTRHLFEVDASGGDASAEAMGMTLFLLSHLYEHSAAGPPPWLLSGMADYVRLSSGFLDPSERAPGGAVTDGFRTTAHFFSWLTESDAEFVRKLNARMAPEQPVYTDAVFEELTQEPLPDLWDEYQASLL